MPVVGFASGKGDPGCEQAAMMRASVRVARRVRLGNVKRSPRLLRTVSAP